jgi:protein ImuB
MNENISGKPRRYLAVWLPFLTSDRFRRQCNGSHARSDAPLCFTEKQNNALRVVRVDQKAMGMGLTPGLTLADARARVPQLAAVEMDHAADMAWLERIADFCDRYTPMTALDAPDGLVLDITGCAHLFGGERALLDDLVARLSHGATQVCAALAGTPQAARALARFGPSHVIVAPGGEAKAVASLPVAALEAGVEATTALLRAGLKTVGDLACRPHKPLVARFGAALVARLVRLQGGENTAITPRRPVPVCSAERRFAEPLTQTGDALATLEALAGHTAHSLEKRGQGGRRFDAALFRTDGTVSRLTIETAQPVRAPETVMRLFRERIDILSDPLDPGYGYDLIRLSVPVSAQLENTQHSLDGRQIEGDDISALIDRLSTRFGRQAVMQFVPAETHIPENAVRAMPAGQPVAHAAQWQAAPADARPMRPVHLFERAQPIEALAEIPDGPPLKFRWRRVLHEIVRAEGPERIAAEWWRGDDGSRTRDYYCVEDSHGHRFWVFRDGLYEELPHHPRWFMHGLFA